MTHLAVTLATVCGAPDFEPPHETATPMVSPASEASMGGSTKYARHDVSTCTDTGVRRWLLLVRTVNVHDLHRLPPSTISFVSPTASLVSLAAMDGAAASTMSQHTARDTTPMEGRTRSSPGLETCLDTRHIGRSTSTRSRSLAG